MTSQSREKCLVSHVGVQIFIISQPKRRVGLTIDTINHISREGLTNKILVNDRICSRHFISGKPAYLFDKNNPDWLPSLHLGHEKQMIADVSRWERAKKRSSSLLPIYSDAVDDDASASASLPVDGSAIVPVDNDENQASASVPILIDSDENRASASVPVDENSACAYTQTEESSSVVDLRKKLTDCRSIIEDMSKRLSEVLPPFCIRSLQKDDDVRFYTGLPNARVLKAVFDHVTASQTCLDTCQKLSSFQQFVLVMMKIRLNCPNQDIAFRFDVSTATVSRLLLKWLITMDIRLNKLIVWPDRESLQKTMPECFELAFGKKVAVILDCFEVFCERPSNLEARASTWSSYKHHNTVKVLLGITPQGSVSYVSETWGGRTSDKYLTEHCGILDNLLPGDVVLADRGFDISDSVGLMHARLHIPAFTKGKSQLSATEIEETRAIANVRIHVERVIGNVRQKYSILQSTLPIHFIIKRTGEEVPLIDRIVRICCALNNVCDSVVPFH